MRHTGEIQTSNKNWAELLTGNASNKLTYFIWQGVHKQKDWHILLFIGEVQQTVKTAGPIKQTRSNIRIFEKLFQSQARRSNFSGQFTVMSFE